MIKKLTIFCSTVVLAIVCVVMCKTHAQLQTFFIINLINTDTWTLV